MNEQEFQALPEWLQRILTQERICSHCGKLFNPREAEYQYFCSYDCYQADRDDCPYCHPEHDDKSTER